MLARFSLYGFLKNQRYFEPFLVLAFLEKGMSFFTIGLVIGFRELCVAILEIPSGAAADVWGRRRCMVLSFGAYIVSFLLLGLADSVPLVFVAMSFFAVGDAFRTGTHKAMILSWLRGRGRADERTRIYGYTRSWSKLGSALSVVLAAVFVFTSDSYVSIFYLSIIPYMIGVVNFLGYPRDVDGQRVDSASVRRVAAHLGATLKRSFATRDTRRLIFEAMGFEGVFHSVKDYLQPVLEATAALYLAGILVGADLSEPQQTALLIGPVYLVLHLLSASASRQAHRLARRSGGEEPAARLLWISASLIFAALFAGGYADLYVVLIAAFVLLHVTQNLWRPVLVARFDSHSREHDGATLLSIESQSRRLATMVTAPLLGLAVDSVRLHGLGGDFWPIGLLGLVVSLLFVATAARGGREKLRAMRR